MKAWIPWYARIAAKLILLRAPAGYGVWRRLSMFAHGSMHKADYAYGVFRQHFERSKFGRKSGGFVALEMGPGDSLLSALVAVAHGANRVHLVDVGAYATGDLRVYEQMVKYLARQGLAAPDLNGIGDLAALLARCNARYGTRGLQSLRDIPTASVDFSWSHAVLEHVRKREFLDTMQELRRVMRSDGVSSHLVDLKDHLGGALNNMRIPSRWWEAEWMARSGFYTNRLRMTEMLNVFRQSGFEVQVNAVQRWDSLPTSVRAMASEFQGVPDAELLVKEFDVTLRPI